MANTTLTLKSGRQTPLVAMIAFTYLNIADTATAVKAINLPYGAVVVGGYLIVDTVFNHGTTSVLDVGDLVDPDRYLVDTDLKTLGKTSLLLTGYASDGEAIYLKPVHVGTAATTGAARLIVEYVINERATETQTN